MSCILVLLFAAAAIFTPGASADACVNTITRHPEMQCNYWAERGECSKNPEFMLKECYRACTYCDFPDICYNENDTCPDWAAKGECDKNPKYMLKSCQLACHKCVIERCHNANTDDAQCVAWANKGECERNPKYMYQSCYKACTHCVPRRASLDQLPTISPTTTTTTTTPAPGVPNHCSPNPCKGHAVCENNPDDAGNSFTCLCPETYSGCGCDILRPSGCPDGFTHVGDSCYKIVAEKSTYDAAETRCNSFYPQYASGYAVVTTKKETDAVIPFLRAELEKDEFKSCKDFGVYFGLQRKGTPGSDGYCDKDNWQWKSKGSCAIPVEYLNWAPPDEPNCAQNLEACAHMWPSKDYKWNDLKCDNACCSLCEVNL